MRLPRLPSDTCARRHTLLIQEVKLQRLFSTFPGGWPGLGLLLLRAAVGINVIINGGGYLVDLKGPTLVRAVLGLLAVAIGASLLIGFVTPVAGILASLGGVGIALSWIPKPASSVLLATPTILFLVVIAIAIVFVGPGAFSLDARLFGRREIIIPRSQRSLKS